MITQVNEITRFFEKLGIRIKIQAPKPGNTTCLVEYLAASELGHTRTKRLLNYYFFAGWTPISDGRFMLRLAAFNSNGHGGTGICKICGCTDDDACLMAVSGVGRTPCSWVQPDLCSACITKCQELGLETRKEEGNE